MLNSSSYMFIDVVHKLFTIFHVNALFKKAFFFRFCTCFACLYTILELFKNIGEVLLHFICSSIGYVNFPWLSILWHGNWPKRGHPLSTNRGLHHISYVSSAGACSGTNYSISFIAWGPGSLTIGSISRRRTNCIGLWLANY